MPVGKLVLLMCVALLPLCGATQEAVPGIGVAVEKREATFLIDSSFEVSVPVPIAWQVLTDFDNMVSIVSNLTSSKIVSREGNTLQVRQEGVARFGFLSYAFTSEREIRLEPHTRIFAKQISGNTKRYLSEMVLTPSDRGTRLRFHAEMDLDSAIGRLFGRSFIEHEVAEQFAEMATEMLKRAATAEKK